MAGRSKNTRDWRGVMAQMAAGGCLLLALVGAGTGAGCDMLKHATADDCEAAYEHVLSVAMEMGDSLGEDLAERAAEWAADKFLDFVGDKDRYVRRCKAALTKAEIRICLQSRTKKKVKKHCSI